MQTWAETQADLAGTVPVEAEAGVSSHGGRSGLQLSSTAADI